MIKHVKEGICICKKDCRYGSENLNMLFHKNNTYKFMFEDDMTAWVFYNEDGGTIDSGRRFYINEKSIHNIYLLSYHEYFENIRKAKLNKIYECSQK